MPEVPIDTPWVSVPGLLTAKCTSNDNASGYLEVTVERQPVGSRAWTTSSATSASAPTCWPTGACTWWTVNLTMGNLLDIVGAQAKAYAAEEVSLKCEVRMQTLTEISPDVHAGLMSGPASPDYRQFIFATRHTCLIDGADVITVLAPPATADPPPPFLPSSS